MKLSGVIALFGIVSLMACHDLGRAPKALVVSVEQQSSWVQRFNPLSPLATPRWPSKGGIYETLMVFNSAQEAWVGVLATGFQWDDSGTLLTLTLREGVKWSDGKPFTVDDVIFTFNLMRQHPGLTPVGLGSISIRSTKPKMVPPFNSGRFMHPLSMALSRHQLLRNTSGRTLPTPSNMQMKRR